MTPPLPTLSHLFTVPFNGLITLSLSFVQWFNDVCEVEGHGLISRWGTRISLFRVRSTIYNGNRMTDLP